MPVQWKHPHYLPLTDWQVCFRHKTAWFLHYPKLPISLMLQAPSKTHVQSAINEKQINSGEWVSRGCTWTAFLISWRWKKNRYMKWKPITTVTEKISKPLMSRCTLWWKTCQYFLFWPLSQNEQLPKLKTPTINFLNQQNCPTENLQMSNIRQVNNHKSCKVQIVSPNCTFWRKL